MPETVAAKDETTLRDDMTMVLATAGALILTDEASFQAGSALLRRIKAVRETIAAFFAPHIARAFEAHRALIADRQRFDGPLAEAERALKADLITFTEAEERRRAAAARVQTAAATDARATQIWTEVESLEAAGYHAEAAALATELVSAPVALVCTPAPLKADGIVRRARWTYAVVDATQVPREYLTIDHHKLGAVVRALKGSVPIPGVRVWAERTMAATRGRR
jgi:hypothetical protein